MFKMFKVSHCYPSELEEFPQELKDLLQRHYMVMDSELRMVFKFVWNIPIWKQSTQGSLIAQWGYLKYFCTKV